MSHRALHFPLAAVALLASAASVGGRHEPSSTLRIESLSRYPINVRVRLTGLARRVPQQRLDTFVQPPAVLPIADSVYGIHVTIIGFGSIRLILTNAVTPGQDSLISEGRDITLSRDARGRFRRIWTVQPLLP